MVAACAQRGAAFACATALWEVPHLAEIGAWVRGGAIGRITAATIDGALADGDQVSGLGCVIISYLRLVTGDEVEWVQGWTTPHGAAASDDDCAAYGVLGMSGGYECTATAAAPGRRRLPTGAVRRAGGGVPARGRGYLLLQAAGAGARRRGPTRARQVGAGSGRWGLPGSAAGARLPSARRARGMRRSKRCRGGCTCRTGCGARSCRTMGAGRG